MASSRILSLLDTEATVSPLPTVFSPWLLGACRPVSLGLSGTSRLSQLSAGLVGGAERVQTGSPLEPAGLRGGADRVGEQTVVSPSDQWLRGVLHREESGPRERLHLLAAQEPLGLRNSVSPDAQPPAPCTRPRPHLPPSCHSASMCSLAQRAQRVTLRAVPGASPETPLKTKGRGAGAASPGGRSQGVGVCCACRAVSGARSLGPATGPARSGAQ